MGRENHLSRNLKGLRSSKRRVIIMKYVAFALFLIWVLVRISSGQDSVAKNRSQVVAAMIVKAAEHRTTQSVRYDPAYVVLDYPGGDVPEETGVCTDVVIRTYREALGVDLQKLVHEDMKRNFSVYPRNWGLKRADKNIDHRRVPNLQKYFKRKGAELPVTDDSKFLPGDLVTWDLNGNGLWHIGVVVADDTFVHNIGGGPVREKGIRAWEIVGHYRFHPAIEEQTD